MRKSINSVLFHINAMCFASRNPNAPKKSLEKRNNFDKSWNVDRKSVLQNPHKLSPPEFTKTLHKIKNENNHIFKSVINSSLLTSNFLSHLPKKIGKFTENDFIELLTNLSGRISDSISKEQIELTWKLIEQEALKRAYTLNTANLVEIIYVFALNGKGSASFYENMEDHLIDIKSEIISHVNVFKLLDKIFFAYSLMNQGSTTFYAEYSFSIKKLNDLEKLTPVQICKIVNYYSRCTNSLKGAFTLYASAEETVLRTAKKLTLSDFVKITESLAPQQVGSNSFYLVIEDIINKLLKTTDDDYQKIIPSLAPKNIVSLSEIVQLFKNFSNHKFQNPELPETLMKKLTHNYEHLTVAQLETVLWSFVRGRYANKDLYKKLEESFIKNMELMKPRGFAFSFEEFMIYGLISSKLFYCYLEKLDKNLKDMKVHYKLKILNGLYHAFYVKIEELTHEKINEQIKKVIQSITQAFDKRSLKGDENKLWRFNDILRFLNLLSENSLKINQDSSLDKLILHFEFCIKKMLETGYINDIIKLPSSFLLPESDQNNSVSNEEDQFDSNDDFSNKPTNEEDQANQSSNSTENQKFQEKINFKLDFSDVCRVFVNFTKANKGSSDFIVQLRDMIINNIVRIPKDIFCEVMFSLVETNSHSVLFKFYPIIEELTRYGDLKIFFSQEQYCLLLYSILNHEIVLKGSYGLNEKAVILVKTKVCTLIQKNFNNVVNDLLEMSTRSFTPFSLKIYIQTLLLYGYFSEKDHFIEIQQKLGEVDELQRSLLVQKSASYATGEKFTETIGNILKVHPNTSGLQQIYNMSDAFFNMIDVAFVEKMTEENQNPENAKKIAVIIMNKYMRLAGNTANDFKLFGLSSKGHSRMCKVNIFILKYIFGWNIIVVDEEIAEKSNLDEETMKKLLYDHLDHMKNEENDDDEVLQESGGGRQKGRRKTKV